jgi:predicted aspartyl protease
MVLALTSIMNTITKSMAVKALKAGQSVYVTFKPDTKFENINAPTFERMRVILIGRKFVRTMTANGQVKIENVQSFDLG